MGILPIKMQRSFLFFEKSTFLILSSIVKLSAMAAQLKALFWLKLSVLFFFPSLTKGKWPVYWQENHDKRKQLNRFAFTASNDAIQLNPNEVFILPIRKTDFDKQITTEDKLLMTATLQGMADLPENVYFKQRDPTRDGLLFGFLDDDQDVDFELIAKHLKTYEIYRTVVRLTFSRKDRALTSDHQISEQI